MAPNMKATERLDDVEHKLRDAEGEADVAKKESKAARDRFNDVKRQRSGIRQLVILPPHITAQDRAIQEGIRPYCRTYRSSVQRSHEGQSRPYGWSCLPELGGQ